MGPENWQLYAFFAFLFFGLQNYCYKLLVVKNLDTRSVTFLYVTLSGFFCLLVSGINQTLLSLSFFTIFLALIDAIAYYTTTVSRIEALRYVPSSLVFPIARFSTVFVVIYGVFIFGDPLTSALFISLAILLIIVLLVVSERNESAQSEKFGLGIGLSLLAMISSVATNIISKYAAIYSEVLNYMAFANLFIALALYAGFKRKNTIIHVNQTSFYLAITLATVNLLGWFSLFHALKFGPLSSVALISSLAFVVPILLSVLFHKEALNYKRTLIVFLTTVVLYVSFN